MDDETRGYFEELRRGLGTLNAKVDTLDAKVDTLDAKVGTLDAKVDTLDAKVDTLNAKVDTLDARADALEAKVDTLQETVAALERRIDLDGERTRRFFQITAEDLRHDIQVVAEGVSLNTEAIGAVRFEIDARFRTSELVSRAAFAAVRRDLAELRAGR